MAGARGAVVPLNVLQALGLAEVIEYLAGRLVVVRAGLRRRCSGRVDEVAGQVVDVGEGADEGEGCLLRCVLLCAGVARRGYAGLALGGLAYRGSEDRLMRWTSYRGGVLGRRLVVDL